VRCEPCLPPGLRRTVRRRRAAAYTPAGRGISLRLQKALDLIKHLCLFSPAWLNPRASSRDVPMMEPQDGRCRRTGIRHPAETGQPASAGAAPARKARDLAPGRPRDPLGGHYDPSARSSLDWEGTKGCRTAEASLAQKAMTRKARRTRTLHQEARTRAQKSPPMERREAPHLRLRGCAHKDGCAARCSIPSDLCSRERNEGRPTRGR
jgi:hypothetical protein